MLNETQTRVLIRTRLLTAAAIPDALWAWENMAFDPPASSPGVIWGRERMQIMAEQRSMSAMERTDGRMIYELLTPLENGTEDLDLAISKIKDVFPPGTWLCHPTDPWTPVQVVRTERLAGRKDEFSPAWYYRPIVIAWRAHSSTPW